MSLTRRAWPSHLFFTLSLGFLGPVSCGDGASSDEGGSEATDDACIEGHEGCPCAEGDLCLGGLTCASGLCVDLGGDGDGATSSSGTMGTSGGDGDASTGTTSSGDGDSTSSTTSDTSGGDGDSTSSTTTDTSGGDGDSTGSTTTDTSGGDGDSTGSTTTDTSGGDGDSTGSTTTDTSGGDGDSTTSTTSTTGGDGDGGNNDGCDAGFTCTKALPFNWQGPVILNEASSNPASCGGGYPSQLDLKNKDLNFSDAECGCVCGNFATDVTCKGEMHVVSNTTCDGLEPSPAEITSGTCQYATVANGESLKVLNTYVFAADCTAASTENIPDYTWDSQGRVCEASGNSWDTCEGTATDVCVPDTDRVCVYRTGTHSCPMWYPYKHELWDTAVDTRDCGSCSCVADEECHTADVWVYPGSANLCNTPQWDTLTPVDGCHDPGSAGANSVYWEPPALGCGVSVPSQPSGTVAEQGAATVCCNAP